MYDNVLVFGFEAIFETRFTVIIEPFHGKTFDLVKICNFTFLHKYYLP